MPRVQNPSRSSSSSAQKSGGSVSGFILLCLILGGVFFAWRNGLLPTEVDCQKLPGLADKQLPSFLTPLHIPQPSQFGLEIKSKSPSSESTSIVAPTQPSQWQPPTTRPQPMQPHPDTDIPVSAPTADKHTQQNNQTNQKKQTKAQKKPISKDSIDKDYSSAPRNLSSLKKYRVILPTDDQISALSIESFQNRLSENQAAPYPRLSTKFKTHYMSMETLLDDLTHKLRELGFTDIETPITDYDNGGTTVIIGKNNNSDEIFIALRSESYDDLTAWKVDFYTKTI